MDFVVVCYAVEYPQAGFLLLQCEDAFSQVQRGTCVVYPRL